MIKTRKRTPSVCRVCRGRPDLVRDLAALEQENRTLRELLRKAAGALRDVHRETANVPAVIQEIEKAS